MVNKILIAFAGGPEKATMRKIVQMSQKNPELNIRLYRTPLGFRALLMNDLYVPNSDNALRILRALNSDRVYIQMCKNQNCFRARVSPKPWRIGVERLRSGVWPISPEKLASRAEWTNKYDKASRDYASCHFVANLGSDKVHEKAEFVRKLHDDFCKACRDDLKIA
jgi:hypothetical protein